MIRLVLTSKDLKANMGSISDCPMARSINRRLKEDYYVSMGGDNFDICERAPTGRRLCEYMLPVQYFAKVKHAQKSGASRVHINVEIPAQYLK